MQTEYQFKLPKGYRSEDGSIHKEGFMRLATAKDEIGASRHPKAKAAPEYATIILLSKVIVKLDGCDFVTPEMIEDMYTADVNFLQNMYETINNNEDLMVRVICPHCGKEFSEPINFYQQD